MLGLAAGETSSCALAPAIRQGGSGLPGSALTGATGHVTTQLDEEEGGGPRREFGLGEARPVACEPSDNAKGEAGGDSEGAEDEPEGPVGPAM